MVLIILSLFIVLIIKWSKSLFALQSSFQNFNPEYGIAGFPPRAGQHGQCRVWRGIVHAGVFEGFKDAAHSQH